MIIVGYRGSVNVNDVTKVFLKHTNMAKNEASTIAKRIANGETLSVENNFLLEEDLKDLNVIIGR